MLLLAGVDVNTNSNEENGDEAKVNDGMDQDGNPTGLHVVKLDHSAIPRQLKQQPRRQQHKQHHCYHHWTPIRHFLPPFPHNLMNRELRDYHTVIKLGDDMRVG